MSKLMSLELGRQCRRPGDYAEHRSYATRAAKTADRSFSSQKYTPTAAVVPSASC